MLGLIIWHIAWWVIYQSSMWLVYHLEHPFFEKYKISKEPWPWNENKTEWVAKVKKSIVL
jgi:hypothetical protein